MAIDAYSLCPGGTGKKIKFCCGDFLPELQKIDRMIEGQQYVACLQHIERLSAQEPGRDRACLLATRCELLHLTDQREAARAAAATFVAKYPDNQIALAESAMVAAETDARAALDWQQRAMRAANGSLAARSYQAIGLTAAAFLREGVVPPARALLQLQVSLAENDERPRQMLVRLCQAAAIPLLLREDPPFGRCSEDAPWKGRFDHAMQSIGLGDWRGAADELTALAAESPDSPVVSRNLATLHGWLADNSGCIEALHKYAALRAHNADGLEDAVEAEAMAMFLSSDPLGDRLDVFKVDWTVKDVERLQEALLLSPRWQSIPFDPARLSDGENPPPKAAYTLLDRAASESAEGLSLETMPRVLAQALLFGRQTDREACLEVVNVTADDRQAVNQMVRDAAGDAVEPEPKEQVIGHGSASQKLLRTAWQPPRDVSPEQFHAMVEQHGREAVLDRWPDLKLGILDGRSPREASGNDKSPGTGPFFSEKSRFQGKQPAENMDLSPSGQGDESCRVRLLAAIMVLEHWAERLPGAIDFNELRARLGLPVPGPIGPGSRPPTELPLVRLERLSLDGLSDDDLISVYYRAGAFAVRTAVRKFAQAIIDRPSLAGSEECLAAHATLARTEEDVRLALEHVDRGRRATEKAGESSASWDLMELSLHFAQRDGREAMRLVEHIERHHLEEPGVGEALTHMFMDVGLLNPDGTPAMGPEAPEPAMAEAPAAESSGLWTPDSAQPGGGGKLWTPE